MKGRKPSIVPLGSTITIAGANFGTAQGSSAVTFNGTGAQTVTGSTFAGLTVNKPSGSLTVTGTLAIGWNLGLPGNVSIATLQMDPTRKVSEEDCSRSIDFTGGNRPGPSDEERQEAVRYRAGEHEKRRQKRENRDGQCADAHPHLKLLPKREDEIKRREMRETTTPSRG
jgi:hypothetical protein